MGPKMTSNIQPVYCCSERSRGARTFWWRANLGPLGVTWELLELARKENMGEVEAEPACCVEIVSGKGEAGVESSAAGEGARQ